VIRKRFHFFRRGCRPGHTTLVDVELGSDPSSTSSTLRRQVRIAVSCRRGLKRFLSLPLSLSSVPNPSLTGGTTRSMPHRGSAQWPPPFKPSDKEFGPR
jgi:hypothetical protein